MKKALAVVLMVMVNFAFAEDWKNPEAQFDASKKTASQMTVVWKTVDNVQTGCDAESRRQGNNGMGTSVQACSFWTGNTCTIVTGKSATMHQLGHEMRHCFQGNYHP